MKKKIKEFTLAELKELAKGKRIFVFQAELYLDKKIPDLLVGKKYLSIKKACLFQSYIIISPERDSYKKTIIDFFPEESDCADEWEISKIKWGIETLVKIGDPHKNKVTPLGIFNFKKDQSYVLLEVSKEIHFLFEIWPYGGFEGTINGIEPLKK